MELRAFDYLRMLASIKKAKMRGYEYQDPDMKMERYFYACSEHDQMKLKVISRLMDELDLKTHGDSQ